MKIRDFVSENYLGNIPANGYCMAVCYDGVFFGKYKIDGDNIITDALPATVSQFKELRLFNKESEYRLRYVSGNKYENIFDSDEEKNVDKDLIYIDEMLLKDIYKNTSGLEKIIVVNRYKYTDYNTITLDNYRITY